MIIKKFNESFETNEILFIEGEFTKIEGDEILIKEGDKEYRISFDLSYFSNIENFKDKTVKITVDGEKLKLIDFFEDDSMFKNFKKFYKEFSNSDGVQKHDILHDFLLDIILNDESYIINLMRIFVTKFKVRGFYRTILTTLKPIKDKVLDEKMKNLYNDMVEELKLI